MNIFEEDTIQIKSKKAAAEHIIKRYGDFGWKLIEDRDDDLYFDVKHLTFTRPHFIGNRDDLQLLQVRLEIAYNNMGKFSHKKNVRASLFGSFFALLSLGLVAGGVCLLLLLKGLLPIIFGSVMCAAGVAAGIFCGLFTDRIYKKDKVKYACLIEKEVQRIEELCKRARALRGVDE